MRRMVGIGGPRPQGRGGVDGGGGVEGGGEGIKPHQESENGRLCRLGSGGCRLSRVQHDTGTSVSSPSHVITPFHNLVYLCGACV
jgi:hypothetical protein